MRAHLPHLADTIVADIRRSIPEYDRPLDGPYGKATRTGVEQAITVFVRKLSDPSTSNEQRNEICRQLGRGEAQEGRALDVLQAAYRIGARAAWREMMAFGAQHELPSQLLGRLADALFGYIDELAAQSLLGYREAQLQMTRTADRWRKRLLRLILDQPAVPFDSVLNFAATVNWPMPETVSLVALEQAPQDHQVLREHTGALLDLSSSQPIVLLPGPVDLEWSRWLRAIFPNTRIAIGPAVTPSEAPTSLRWARQTLELVRSGVLADAHTTRAEDHLAELWLNLDPAIPRQLARRRLQPLRRLPDKQRAKLAATLLVWLQTHGSAPEIGQALGVHPQTVRYRLRQLEELFGDALTDEQASFDMLLALRAGAS